MRPMGIFVRLALVVVALVVAGMLALSAFTVKIPMSSVTTKTVDGTEVTTTCTWLRSLLDPLKECTTTRAPASN